MVNLGSKVRDIITEVEGVALGRTEWLYGCARIAIESVALKKDGKPSDIVWMDEQRVEVTGEGKVACPPEKHVPFALGNHVRDRVTGFDGLCVSITKWLGGEVNITIEPTKLHDGKPIDAHAFSLERVELVEEKNPPVSKSNSARSGGPQDDPAPLR